MKFSPCKTNKRGAVLSREGKIWEGEVWFRAPALEILTTV
jgi:hypothetical protein